MRRTSARGPDPDAGFTLVVPIRFGDCDPAGILYYPRYFDLFHQAMEAWFDGPLDLPYATFIQDHGLGLPAVHAEADYKAPTAYGERVGVQLQVARLGRTSIGFQYAVWGDERTLRATGRTVCVVMDLDPARSTFRRALPVPSTLLERMRVANALPPG